MNASLANLTLSPPAPTPKPSVPAPVDRRAPQEPSPNRDANNRPENPKSNPRPSANEDGRARPEISNKPSRDKSSTNHCAADKKSSGDDKISMQDATLVAAGIETQVNVQTEPAGGSTAVFATILQAAAQTTEAPTSDTAKTKEAVAAGVLVAMPVVSPEGKVTLGRTAPVWAPVQSTGPEQTTALVAPVATVATVAPIAPIAADAGVLQKALAPVVQGKVLSDEGGTGEKVALPTTPTGDNPVIAARTVMNPGLAAQVSDQTHKAIEPVVVQDGAIPKQSPMASMQGAVPAADTIARSVRPKSRHGARNTVTLQTESSQQAKVADPVSQGVLQRQMGILSQGGVGQQGRFVVKESTGTPQSQNNVVGEIATSTGTTTIEAVRGGAPEAGSPVRQISEAFQSSAARNGQEIVIRLDPPELGRVSVRLRLEGNAVRGILEVENPRTLSQLQREAPNIMNRLTDAGIEMKRMELSLSENSSRDSMRDSMRDSSWFSQQYGENGAGHDGWNSPGYRRQTDETLPEGSDMAGGFQPALTTIGDDSINIWI